MPLGIDDPKSKSSISDLVMTLYGGANEGTISRGSCNPTCKAIISANFVVNESEKYVFRQILFNWWFLAAVSMVVDSGDSTVKTGVSGNWNL